MSVPFGKMKKSPQQHAVWYLSWVEAFVLEKWGKDYNKKALMKFDKYMGRMVEIMNGSSKKCKKTSENVLKIASEFGKHVDIVTGSLVHLEVFTPENRKNVIEILGEVMKIKNDTNPLSEGLASVIEETIDKIFDKFDTATMSIHYSNILKIMTNQTPLISSFLKIDIFKRLAGFIWNEVFDISSEALSLLEEILFSDNKEVQKQNHVFLNQYKVEMMEIFMHLVQQENYLAKREAMKILFEILLTKGNEEFHNYFVSDKEYLKFTMISLNDDSTGISVEAFHLLGVFLQSPSEVRGAKVNDTLNKNWERLIDFIDHFQEDKEGDENFDHQKEIAKKQLKKIIEERDSQ